MRVHTPICLARALARVRARARFCFFEFVVRMLSTKGTSGTGRGTGKGTGASTIGTRDIGRVESILVEETFDH